MKKAQNLLGLLVVALFAMALMIHFVVQLGGGNLLLSTQKTGFIGFKDFSAGRSASQLLPEFMGARLSTVHGRDYRLSVVVPVACHRGIATPGVLVVPDSGVSTPVLSVDLPLYMSVIPQAASVLPTSIMLHVQPTDVESWKARIAKATGGYCLPKPVRNNGKVLTT